MFTEWNEFTPEARSAATACAEKPHCGKSGVPFMNSTAGLLPMWVLIRLSTSSATCLLLVSNFASTAHCASALIAPHAAISSIVRKQPVQRSPVSTQTLMHGDCGRSMVGARSALNYGGSSPILQTAHRGD